MPAGICEYFPDGREKTVFARSKSAACRRKFSLDQCLGEILRSWPAAEFRLSKTRSAAEWQRNLATVLFLCILIENLI
jgi:hypothetical protein